MSDLRPTWLPVLAFVLGCTSTERGAPDAAPVGELATFGAGCFWCSEAAFEQIEGVVDVRSGFMGGDVAPGVTDPHALVAAGCAEVVQVRYDPDVVAYETLLDWFWRVHDPTSLNRQGADEGPEYRSVVFFHSEEQREAAVASRTGAQKGFEQPIVTEIVPAGRFYPASAEHQDYYAKHRGSAYCRTTIAPHLLKVGLED